MWQLRERMLALAVQVAKEGESSFDTIDRAKEFTRWVYYGGYIIVDGQFVTTLVMEPWQRPMSFAPD